MDEGSAATREAQVKTPCRGQGSRRGAAQALRHNIDRQWRSGGAKGKGPPGLSKVTTRDSVKCQSRPDTLSGSLG